MVQVPLWAVMTIIPAFILGVLVMLGGNALLRVYTNNVAYPAYMETLDLSEGSIGNAPIPDTPQAKSVADMQGDFGLVMTEGEFHAQHPGFDIVQNASIIIMPFLWLAFWIFFTKKGWF